MLTGDYRSPYCSLKWSTPYKIAKSRGPIVEAVQTKPESRAAKRQAEREKGRKWPTEYVKEVEEKNGL